MPTEFPAADSTAIQLGVVDSLEPGAIQPMPADTTPSNLTPPWSGGVVQSDPSIPTMLGQDAAVAQIIIVDPMVQL